MSRFFEDIELTTWALVSTPAFLLIFSVIVFVVFHPKNKKRMEHISLLPLKEDMTAKGVEHGK